MDVAQIEYAVLELLYAVGEYPARNGLSETPERVARMYQEIFSGYALDPREVLSTTFEEAHREMVIVREIQFFSHCEHHMVPFFGQVHIGYIPDGRVIGISKFARLVDCLSKRLQIQERMTSQIADTIMEVLKPEGCGVWVSAQHLCMQMRGVKNGTAQTETSAMRGSFLKEPETRAEFLKAVLR